MRTLTLEIENESIADKIIWMLNHFSNDGLVIKECKNIDHQIDTQSSILQAVNEINLIKDGKLEAKPIEQLLNAI